MEKLVARRGDAALYLLTSKESCPFYEACGFEAMPPWSLPRCIPADARTLEVYRMKSSLASTCSVSLLFCSQGGTCRPSPTVTMGNARQLSWSTTHT